MYFIADPAKPLDGNLRATFVRIASAKTPGECLVFSCFWGAETFRVACTMMRFELVGTKIPASAEEDVSQLLEKLKVSTGGGGMSVSLGQSDV